MTTTLILQSGSVSTQHVVLRLRIISEAEKISLFLSKVKVSPLFSDQQKINELSSLFDDKYLKALNTDEGKEDAAIALSLFITELIYPAIRSETNENNQDLLLEYEDDVKDILKDLLKDGASINEFVKQNDFYTQEQQALLGSDGKTYGKMSLALYMHSIPEQQRNRSPFNPQNPALFSTIPHPIVRYMTNWLKERQALLYSEEIERRYRELMEQRRIANPQNERLNRIRHIQEIQQQRDLHRNFAHLPQIQQVAQELIYDIQGQFQPLHQQLQRNDEGRLAHLEHYQQQHQEQLERLEDRAQEFQIGVAEANQHHPAIQNQVEQMDRMLERRRRIQNILQRQGIGNRERIEQREALAQDLLARQQEVERVIEGNFVPIQLQNQQNREANLARLQAIELNDQLQAEVLRRQIQRLQRNVEVLDLENRQLQNQIERVEIGIREAEKDDARLQISIRHNVIALR